MKALIEIEMGNAAFGNNEAERLFELRQVTERLIDNATHIMAAKAGDYASAQDTNGNTVARLYIVGPNDGRHEEFGGLAGHQRGSRKLDPNLHNYQQ